MRAATTDPARIASWWSERPDAPIGAAAGPSGLVLIDIDQHGADSPHTPATGLLPGIDLATEPITPSLWTNPHTVRTGRDSLRLLGRLRGGRNPWPTDPEHAPVTADTPSGGRHLWYRAPAPDLCQALSPTGLAWQVDLKAGWSYGLAPGTRTAKGEYRHDGADLERVGHMPAWLAHEVIRVAGPRPATGPTPSRHTPIAGSTRGAYVNAVLARGVAQLSALTDGRRRALSALAFQIGGYLAWAGLSEDDVARDLLDAGRAAGLDDRTAHSLTRTALANGQRQPLVPKPHNR